MVEEPYQKTVETQKMSIKGLDHSHREKEEENPQEVDIGKTKTIYQETTKETIPEILETTIKDHQETDTEAEDMKTEVAAEKETMKMKGQRGPAMADKADPEMVARSP